ncbi:uncharacterized protein [Cicer arietinum]|uniref:protein-tyrosine-phosphatase n=1 Tax=Cicer arietinum TaxID=3827 RepID=A0A1S2XTJ5_CICAR|nr:dual specificity protein phosphatase 12-like isoform X2 [Cicer arietinum]
MLLRFSKTAPFTTTTTSHTYSPFSAPLPFPSSPNGVPPSPSPSKRSPNSTSPTSPPPPSSLSRRTNSSTRSSTPVKTSSSSEWQFLLRIQRTRICWITFKFASISLIVVGKKVPFWFTVSLVFLEDALESLRQSCEFVCPNDGFLEQLKMFEEMGFKVDQSSSIYKRFRLKILGENHFSGLRIDSSKLGADPGVPVESSSEVDEATKVKSNSSPTYRCKKCRRIVALQEHVVDHIPGEGETSFGWQKRRSGNPFNKSNESECSSIFIEPLRWMKAVEEGALEGKLSCAHCDARLGYFNWAGIQCSCGSWITPAFQLHKSRVDISPV